MELFILRKEYRISAHEAEEEMPLWEREMLLAPHRELIDKILKDPKEEKTDLPDDLPPEVKAML